MCRFTSTLQEVRIKLQVKLQELVSSHLICTNCCKIYFRALDPVVLPSEASQAVKQRLINFVQSLSTVLAFAYCLSR